MKPVRTAARAMLASIFVISGVRVLMNPGEGRVQSARRVTDRITPLLEKTDPRLPTDPATLVRAKAAADVVAGLALASGHFTRPAAAVLAAGLLPTTVAGHPFWAAPKEERPAQEIHFLKNLGLLGGLLLAAADTEGKPSLRYRTTHAVDRSQHRLNRAVDRSQREMRRAVRTAKREARIAALSATAARKLPG
ncbi:DoxX family membrane protein [Actinoplanes sp. DH11]|uniref:DoxX family membrane protein n=1 Tax=Actinoplanes sp. DH11 TaxID=2857011 RepID=UPI001E463D62|nr:DoxX family protein [Actinoplanes sp. DH11]